MSLAFLAWLHDPTWNCTVEAQRTMVLRKIIGEFNVTKNVSAAKELFAWHNGIVKAPRPLQLAYTGEIWHGRNTMQRIGSCQAAIENVSKKDAWQLRSEQKRF